MYELTHETEKRRTYRSQQTETEVHTFLLFTDGAKNNWWAFEDLLNIPFHRKKAAENITQFYSSGITVDDLNSFIENHKATLKSTDADKYEKAFAEVIQLERLKEQAGDPVKQCLGLCTVYVLADAEQIDIWNQSNAALKMNLWALDIKLQSFFLNWLTDGMNNLQEHLKSLSQIVSIVSQ